MVQTRRMSAARAEQATGGWTRQPADTKPSFTVAQLRKAIPAHCWKRSLFRSSAYLLTDLVMLAALVWASGHIDAAPLPAAARWLVLWPLYWFFAGAVATGIWVSEPAGGRWHGHRQPEAPKTERCGGWVSNWRRLLPGLLPLFCINPAACLHKLHPPLP